MTYGQSAHPHFHLYMGCRTARAIADIRDSVEAVTSVVGTVSGVLDALGGPQTAPPLSTPEPDQWDALSKGLFLTANSVSRLTQELEALRLSTRSQPTPSTTPMHLEQDTSLSVSINSAPSTNDTVSSVPKSRSAGPTVTPTMHRLLQSRSATTSRTPPTPVSSLNRVAARSQLSAAAAAATPPASRRPSAPPPGISESKAQI